MEENVMRAPIAAAMLALLPLASIAPVDAAEAKFPTKPLRFLVGFPPGGGNDAIARLITPGFSERLGVPVVLDNRPGAGGNIAADIAAKAPADGYTILVASSSHPIQGLLKSGLPYDPVKDFAGVSLLVVYRSILVVPPSVPATTVKDIIALARAKPGTLNFASSGSGTGSHLGGELFKAATKVDMTHVAYKGGGQAVVDLLAGRVDLMFSPLVPVLAHIRANRLRPIAVTSTNRSPLLPELPTIAEAGVPGYEFVSWYGVMAPKGTPPAVAERMANEIRQVMQRPEVLKQTRGEDMDTIASSPAEFDKIRSAMIPKWEKIVKQPGFEGKQAGS